MHAEYITLNSKLSLKSDVIIEKKIKHDTELGFTRFIAFVALLGILYLSMHRIVEDKNYWYISQVILVIFWLEPHAKRIYRSLFITTWKSALRLDSIEKISKATTGNDLETTIILHLKNGRKKIFVFRNAENQVDDFIANIENRMQTVQ